MKRATYAIAVTAVMNIILDPIFIYVLNFGITGAAWATVIGQIVALIVSLLLNLKKNSDINFSIKNFSFSWRIIGDIYKVGVPSILLGSVGSILTYLLNMILGTFSTTAIAVYGIYFKLQSFVFMPVFGLNNGIVPIVAYNYGAKYKERITKSIKLCAIAAISIMLFGLAVFEIFPKALLGMFAPTEEMLKIGIPALRIIALHFPVAAVCITAYCIRRRKN